MLEVSDMNKKARYKRMELIITAALCVDAAIFLAYMIFAGMGMIGMKVVTAIFCFLFSGAILYYLFMTRELLRRRSFWMTVAAACIVVCLLFSLILKFPAPKFTLPQ